MQARDETMIVRVVIKNLLAKKVAITRGKVAMLVEIKVRDSKNQNARKLIPIAITFYTTSEIQTSLRKSSH
jgi:hypothetical protein